MPTLKHYGHWYLFVIPLRRFLVHVYERNLPLFAPPFLIADFSSMFILWGRKLNDFIIFLKISIILLYMKTKFLFNFLREEIELGLYIVFLLFSPQEPLLKMHLEPYMVLESTNARQMPEPLDYLFFLKTKFLYLLTSSGFLGLFLILDVANYIEIDIRVHISFENSILDSWSRCMAWNGWVM